MKKKVIVKAIIIFVIITILAGFWQINKLNYGKHVEIKHSYIKHPENISKKEVAKLTSFGFKNVKADLYRLETIQYIGGNAISSEYKKYLYKILDLVTELNPNFKNPYKIGLLLLPSYNYRYENLTEEEQNKYINQSIELGNKGLKNFCDLKKINLIKKEYNLKDIWTLDKYKDPCKTYEIPYYLAYVYFEYLHDGLNAADLYKIASANHDALKGARTMSAIMLGKGGNREKAFFMFLNIAQNLDLSNDVEIDKKNKGCYQYAKKLEENVGGFFQKPELLTGKKLKIINDIRDKVFGLYDEIKEEQLLSDSECSGFVNKAHRELNLFYLDNANKKFYSDNQKNSFTPEQLKKEGYIDYIPKDFQQYDDHGIGYEFNEEYGRYDAKMQYKD